MTSVFEGGLYLPVVIDMGRGDVYGIAGVEKCFVGLKYCIEPDTCCETAALLHVGDIDSAYLYAAHKACFRHKASGDTTASTNAEANNLLRLFAERCR